MSEKYEQMMKQFPHLYADRNASMQVTCMCWGIDCGEGWHDIIRDLSAELEAMILKLPPEAQEQVKASQVKEKYGGLRFYMTASTDEMEKAIGRASRKCSTICEDCGQPGKNEELFGWWRTRCHDCYLAELVYRCPSRLTLLIETGIAVTQAEWNKYKAKHKDK